MSEDEKLFIDKHIVTKKQSQVFRKSRTPWRQIVFSSTSLAIFTSQFAYNFSASIMQAFLPTYFKENGLFTMVPFVAQLSSKLVLGHVSDTMKRKEMLDADISVKLFQGIGAFGSAASLMALAMLPSCERPLIALPILIAYGVFFSAGICGFFTSLVNIAPAYSGTLTSISMTYATVANFSGPLLLSLIEHMDWPHKWLITFATAAVLNIISGFYFIFYGRGRVQDWAAMPPAKTETI